MSLNACVVLCSTVLLSLHPSPLIFDLLFALSRHDEVHWLAEGSLVRPGS